MRIAASLSLAALLAAGTLVSNASATVITGVTATASSTGDGSASLAVNGTGLDVTGTYHGYDASSSAWLSNFYTAAPHYLTANLQSTFTVDSIHVWNYYAKSNEFAYNPDTNANDGAPIDPSQYAVTRGVQNVDLFFTSSDAVALTAPSLVNGWSLLESGVTFDEAPPALVQADYSVNASPYAGQTINFTTPVEAKYISINILSNYGDGGSRGLSEVQFNAVVPEPTSLALLGAVGLIGIRRRRHA